MRATITKVGLMIALLLCVGCGGGANSVVSTPPPPPPPPPVNPAIVWVGDVQVSSGLGDHGIGTSGASGVAMVPDASGGVILVWEDATYALVHAQHIGANGDLRWQITGVSPSDIDTYEASPEAVSDGSGGIIVAWVDGRAGFCDEGFQANCDIYAQRIDSTGNLLWNPSGIPIATASGNHGFSGIAIASDGAGGAIIAWEDGRPVCCGIYAQRVSGSGQLFWAADGVQVSPTPTIVIGTIGVPQMIADGSGGAIVAWWNTQYTDPNQEFTVSSQRLAANGTRMWDAQGVTVQGVTGGGANGNMLSYSLTTDGNGGAIFGGSFFSQNSGMMAVQLVDGTGHVAWNANGVQIASVLSHVLSPALVSDGSGGAIATWIDCVMQGVKCSVSVQRVDHSGHLLWSANNISITRTPNLKYGPIAMSDGAGGAFLAWEDCPNVGDYNTCLLGIDLYAQRINPAGQAMWQVDGFPVSTASDNQGTQNGNLSAGIYWSADDLGNIFLGWPDGRINHRCAFAPVGLPSHCDLFAQKLH